MMRTIAITLLLAQCCQVAAADEPKLANEDSLKSLDLACAETPLAIQIAAAADAPTVYSERYRPQFHYTTKKGWINDPCGLVYFDGEYHLFNDHNPFGTNVPGETPGSTEQPPSRWSHAVSRDLVHWQELPVAVMPSKLGGVFTGSGVVDKNNTAGFGTNALVLVYTSARKPFTQSISYSTDKGRTWTFYEKNPILPNQKMMAAERDPYVFWHEPTKRWVMLLFVKMGVMRFFSSPDLKDWTFISDYRLPGLHECPGFVEMPLDGDPNRKLWVLYDASSDYQVGTFDGREFAPQTEKLPGDRGDNFYAPQVWQNAPDGRCIQIGWMDWGKFPEMPFNQQQSFPCELKLISTPYGPRLTRMPVPEIAALYQNNPATMSKTTLKEGDQNPLAGISGELFDIELTFRPGKRSTLELAFHEGAITWSNEGRMDSFGRLKRALVPISGAVKLRILVDRTSVEVFGNDGLLSMTSSIVPKNLTTGLTLRVNDDPVEIESLMVRKLNSAWPERGTRK